MEGPSVAANGRTLPAKCSGGSTSTNNKCRKYRIL